MQECLMRKNSFKAALVQMDSGADEQKNMRRAEALLDRAATAGASLVVFPETVDYIGTEMREHAKTVPGQWDQFFSSKSKDYGIYIHGGSITQRNDRGNPYNTSLMFGPDGSCICDYKKLHMFDVEVADGPAYRESDGIEPGNEIVLADTALACFGLSICYDVRFPELYRIMAGNGATAMIVAANFTRATGQKHWKTLLRARAIENTCYVLACCQCGDKPAFTAHGHSMIISPMGEVLAEGGDEETLVMARIAPDEVANTRQQIPSLGNVRDDVYQLTSRNIRIYSKI